VLAYATVNSRVSSKVWKLLTAPPFLPLDVSP